MRQFLPEETLLQTVELDIQEFSPKSLADLRKGKYCEVDRLLADFAQCVWTETNKHVLITLNNLQIIYFFYWAYPVNRSYPAPWKTKPAKKMMKR